MMGIYSLHGDANINFQLNRCIAWGGEETIDELQDAALRIHNFEDWKRELLILAERAEVNRKYLQSAYYYRSAEFFMATSDPDKVKTYDRFIELMGTEFPKYKAARELVPYEGGYLPAWRLRPTASALGTIVLHGGFDSFIEELYPHLDDILVRGFELILFEGPGQGAALIRYGIPMTHEWEKPLSAILTYFGVEEVSLIGMSLGGYLALRAAAYDVRVKRVVAFDALYDFYDCLMAKLGPRQRMLTLLQSLRADWLIDIAIEAVASRNLLVKWGISQGMHTTGSRKPSAFLRKLRAYSAKDISALVRQDVLIMGGSADHFLKIDQFYNQVEALTATRSLTARLFTEAEGAQSHCQIGNFPLAIDTILRWIEERSGRV
jgi:hypothetical protein